VYGPGKAYNIFAGKDGSKGLGMSSLKPEDAVPDYSDLPENEKNVLNDWFLFFQYVPKFVWTNVSLALIFT
jgi:membrane-associated progesterone receptor component